MNTKILIKIVIFLLLSIFIQSISAQNDIYLKKILNNYKTMDSYIHRQKVFVHTDKNKYSPSESIMLKAYVLNTLNIPDSFSSILRVEILDPSNKLLFEQNLKIIDGKCVGDFKLPDDIHGGNYSLRAYTNFMKNFEPEKIFIKPIIIQNDNVFFYKQELFDKKKKNRRKKSKKIKFNFLPEGGVLTAGFKNKINFYAGDSPNKNLEVKGRIIDKDKNLIVDFDSKNGNGYFYFTPQTGHKYTAEVIVAKQKIKIKLPKISNANHRLYLQNVDDKNYKFCIENNLSNSDDKFAKTVVLIARIPGKILFGKQILCDIKSKIIVVEKKNLPAGIINFILLNASGNKIAERFVYNDNENKIIIKSKKKNIGDSILINLSLSGENINTTQNNLSVSVTTKHDSAYKFNENIKLYSEITSRTNESPEFVYNFIEKNNDFDLLVDKLKINDNQEKIIEKNNLKYNVQKSFSLSGKVTKQMLEIPASHKKITLYVLNKHNDRYTTLTNKNGNFIFKNLEYNDTIEIMLETLNEKMKKAYIIDIDKYEEFITPEINIYNLKTEIENLKKGRKYYKKNYNYVQQKDSLRHEDGRLHSYVDQTIYMKDISANAYTDVMQLLQAYVPGISKYSMSVLRGITSINLSSEPLYLMDGVPTDKSFMSSMTPDNIERIEILKNPGNTAIYGSRGANGVVAVYSKKGRNTILGELKIKMLGYHTPNKFVFDTNKKRTNRETTLYWNPQLKIDKKGQASFKFKVPKECENYSIIIQGISNDGTPIYFVKHYKIR